ncbi:MAG: M23 family metallopeptidase [Candidatus Margulisbacteria bacterium]|jgi:murein DD-endopeptidase MepM/ murein hydrolase activator NlpD|nr:M23 family metallopeptidase [Candidatus Margulisiibacteriota bacterium]
MRQARRKTEGGKYISFAFCLSDRHAPVYLRASAAWLAALGLTALGLLLLTVLISPNSAGWRQKMADYPQVRSRNQLLNTKIGLAAARQKQLKEYIHDLKIQEEEIKELLSFEDWPLVRADASASPLIAAHRIISPGGEFGRVLIDNNTVVEYFDNGHRPLAYQRALVTAEKLKGLLAGRTAARRFTTKKAGSSVYAYINDQPILIALQSDLTHLQEQLSAEQLAKYWLGNIQTALTATQRRKNSGSSPDWFKKENRRKSRIYKTLYPSINYPAYALAPDISADPRLQMADHLLKLSRQEIAIYAKSFQELKNDVQVYKQRFEYTPSIFPVPNSYIFSDFGWRQHPILRSMRFHSGIDLPSWHGAPIYATAAGTVKKIGWSAGYGNFVEVDHGAGFSTLYGHNSTNLVEAGQQVRKGQLIARVGSTGLSEGDHCHYEVHYYDRPVNPVKFLNLNIFTANHNF